MIKRLIFCISISFFLLSCGFTPIYQSKNSPGIKIEKISFEGDKLINNYLNLYLKRFTKKVSDKNFIINVNTKYVKKVLSKDLTGKAVDYELNTNINFDITLNGNFIKTIRLSEKFIMQKNDDKYEGQNYENSIKQNFANSIYEKLIIQLTNLKNDT
jgi:hypothetical protein